MVDSITIGKRVTEYRKQKKITQAALAEAICIFPSQMSRIARGERMPTTRQVIDLARELGVTPNDIVGEEGEQCLYTIS